VSTRCSVTRASTTWSWRCRPNSRRAAAYLRQRDKPLVVVEAVPGGRIPWRARSRAIPSGTEIVVIHDAARPLVTADLIERTVAAAAADGPPWRPCAPPTP
jgi:hypothetical protein